MDSSSPPRPQITQRCLHDQPGDLRPSAHHLLTNEGLLLCHTQMASGKHGVRMAHDAFSQQHPLQRSLHHLHQHRPAAGCSLPSEVTPTSVLVQRHKRSCARLADCGDGEYPRESEPFKLFEKQHFECFHLF